MVGGRMRGRRTDGGKISAASEGVRCAASVSSFFLVSSLLGVAEVGPAELGEAVAVDLLVPLPTL